MHAQVSPEALLFPSLPAAVLQQRLSAVQEAAGAEYRGEGLLQGEGLKELLPAT